MPPPAKSTAPVLLVFGEDEFSVKQRAAQVYREWVGPASDAAPFDHEIIDAAAANSGEVLKVLARLRAALQTLPFFGGTRVVWLQNCNFLGDERAAASQAVTDALAELADELKAFPWSERGGVRLLISAGKVDKRKLFFKTLRRGPARRSAPGARRSPTKRWKI
jgi:DNA polymerase-3 subunit delta